MSNRNKPKPNSPVKNNPTVPEARQTAIAVRQTTFSAFQGPLPPPEMLARYNDCVPNGAERVLALAERQAKHRQELEGSVVQGNLNATVRGQVFAFVLGLLTIGGGFWLVGQGKDAYGLAAIITAFATLAGVFIYGRIRQERERERKRQEVREAQAQLRLPYEQAADESSN